MTKYNLPKEEIEHLRKLAMKQKEFSELPVMEERKMLWQNVNDAVPGARPIFAMESYTFERDFLPESLLQCESDYGKELERNFLRKTRQHEILNDDHVCPDTIDMSWHMWKDEFGIKIEAEEAIDSEGVSTGYHFKCPITDLSKDGFDMVKPSTFGINRESTKEEKSFLEECFGDILPVVIRSEGVHANNNLTQRLMRLMSMESFFLSMYDCPDSLHGIMNLLKENAKRQALWAEEEGLLVLNNGNQKTCGTCFNFTSKLPRREVVEGKVKLSDMWGVMDSQEAVGVSPELFHEFVYPYYEELAKMYGFVYWGCCEPVDPIWETSISKLPNLRAVSISKWANEEYMFDALDKKEIVYSRKPNPNFLSVDVSLNEEAWAEDIRKTLKIAQGKNVPLEFIVRDVYTLHGDINNAVRAVEVARSVINEFYD